jgi:hypothetical protein
MSTKREVIYIDKDKSYIFQCPHCNIYVQVLKTEVNCQIFRHGVIINTGKHIDPHASEEVCDKLVRENLVYGCCKPFKLFFGKNGIITHSDICDYSE